jgi:hypothetical protein
MMLTKTSIQFKQNGRFLTFAIVTLIPINGLISPVNKILKHCLSNALALNYSLYNEQKKVQ